MIRKTAVRYLERKHYHFSPAPRLPVFVSRALWAHSRPTTKPGAPEIGTVDTDLRFTTMPTTLNLLV